MSFQHLNTFLILTASSDGRRAGKTRKSNYFVVWTVFDFIICSQFCKYDNGQTSYNAERHPDTDEFHCQRCPKTFIKGSELAVSYITVTMLLVLKHF